MVGVNGEGKRGAKKERGEGKEHLLQEPGYSIYTHQFPGNQVMLNVSISPIRNWRMDDFM